MALTHPTQRRLAVLPSLPIWRFSVEQYHAMIDGGILTDDDPVELLHGWLVPKMPKKPPHRVATLLLRSALERLVPKGWYVDSQEPITTADSEPEPDVVVVRGDTRQYLDRHPGPGDLALAAEVADATLDRDRGVKKNLYAAAGIQVYWIVNLPEKKIEVYDDPAGTGDLADYRRHRDYGIGDAVPVLVDDVVLGHLEVRALLP